LKKPGNDGFGVLGIGAAACLACCAGSILAVFGGVGIAALASTVAIGAAGLLITVAAVAAIVVVRRRRTTCVVPDEGPVAVTISNRRPLRPDTTVEVS
jgi:hypothetical protein